MSILVPRHGRAINLVTMRTFRGEVGRHYPYLPVIFTCDHCHVLAQYAGQGLE